MRKYFLLLPLLFLLAIIPANALSVKESIYPSTDSGSLVKESIAPIMIDYPTPIPMPYSFPPE